eukprot:gene15953-biopygen15781
MFLSPAQGTPSDVHDTATNVMGQHTQDLNKESTRVQRTQQGVNQNSMDSTSLDLAPCVTSPGNPRQVSNDSRVGGPQKSAGNRQNPIHCSQITAFAGFLVKRSPRPSFRRLQSVPTHWRHRGGAPCARRPMCPSPRRRRRSAAGRPPPPRSRGRGKGRRHEPKDGEEAPAGWLQRAGPKQSRARARGAVGLHSMAWPAFYDCCWRLSAFCGGAVAAVGLHFMAVGLHFGRSIF